MTLPEGAGCSERNLNLIFPVGAHPTPSAASGCGCVPYELCDGFLRHTDRIESQSLEFRVQRREILVEHLLHSVGLHFQLGLHIVEDWRGISNGPRITARDDAHDRREPVV